MIPSSTPGSQGQQRYPGSPGQQRETLWTYHHVWRPDSVSSVIMRVTAAMAREKRDSAHFERQRALRHNNIARLAEEMRGGRYIRGTQVFIAVLPDGSEALLNANHSFEAIVESGLPQLMTVTYCSVRDIDEAGRIYAVLDTHAIRTWADSLRSVGKTDAVPNARAVVAAIGVIERKMDQFGKREGETFNARLSRMDKLDTEYKEAAELFACSVADGSAARICKVAPIMAVALLTLKHQPSSAVEFWERVAKDEGLKKGHPERALLNWLRNQPFHLGTGSRRAIAVRAASSAWNAHFRGDEIEMVKPNAMTKYFLLGTPFDRGIPEDA